MPTITVTVKDEDQSWIVDTPFNVLTPDILDWLIDTMQKKLNNDPQGRKYLDEPTTKE